MLFDWLASLVSFALATGSRAQFFTIQYLLHQSFSWNNWLGRGTGLLNEHQLYIIIVLIQKHATLTLC